MVCKRDRGAAARTVEIILPDIDGPVAHHNRSCQYRQAPGKEEKANPHALRPPMRVLEGEYTLLENAPSRANLSLSSFLNNLVKGICACTMSGRKNRHPKLV